METVYIDSLFVLNLAVDYLLLLAAGSICSCRLRRGRILAGAVLGAGYSVLTLLPWGRLLLTLPVKLALGFAMVQLAYRGEKAPLRRFLVFLAVSAAFGGAIWAVSLLDGPRPADGAFYPVSLRTLLLSFTLCYAALSLVFRRTADRTERQIAKLELHHRGRSVTLHALRDTGNGLYDPLSGDRVCVAEAGAIAPLFDPEIQGCLTLSNGLEMFSALSRTESGRGLFRLIPYVSLGTENGLIAAFRPDRVLADGRSVPGLLVAVSPDMLGQDGDYTAIW